MKTSNIIILLIVAIIFFYFYEAKTAATKEDLEAVRKELKAQIDSVLKDTDTLKTEVQYIKNNTDSLRAGQEIIFLKMRENETKETLKEKILNFFK